MSETTVVNLTAEAPKKRRGCPKGGWPKKETAAVTREKLPVAMQGEALEKFAYKGTPGEMDDWEANEDVSPMHVPKEIRTAYPNLSFRYVSAYGVKTRGANYHGWQKFSDNQFPEGVKRGNDMYLAAMPKERAQRYRDKVAEDSVQRIRSRQEKSLEFQIGQGLSKEEMEKMGIPAGSEAGLLIGVRPKTKTRFGNRTVIGGGGQRGMSRAEAHEHIRREVEDRKKKRVYSFAK